MINIKNIEFFKWCIVRYLHPADHNPRRIIKNYTEFTYNLDLKASNFQSKIEICKKIEKKNSIGITVFGYKNKEKQRIYVSKKCCEEKHVYLLLVKEEGKRHYVFIKEFNTFIYADTKHPGRKYF